MKILYISGSTFPSEISHTLSKMRMCQAFHDLGSDVLLSAATDKDMNDKEVIEGYGLSGGFLLSLYKKNSFLNNKVSKSFFLEKIILALHARKNYLNFKPDLIYSRLTLIELFFIPNTTPIIYEMHSLGFFKKSKLSRILFNYLIKIKNFKRIIVSTEILKSMLKKEISTIDIVVARLSAEEPIKITDNEKEVFYQKNLEGKKYSSHVGYTGYLDRIGLRGTDIICHIASKMPDVGFHIVGGKPDIVEYWKSYSKDFNQNKNIFFYGYRNPSEIPFFLKCFDIVLAPLQYKPLDRAPTGANMSPLKLPQYMAYNKTIVASDIPSHHEVLKDNYNAVLVEHSKVEQWVDAIKSLINNQKKRNTLESNALNDYFNEFTPSSRIERILNGFENKSHI